MVYNRLAKLSHYTKSHKGDYETMSDNIIQ